MEPRRIRGGTRAGRPAGRQRRSGHDPGPSAIRREAEVRGIGRSAGTAGTGRGRRRCHRQRLHGQRRRRARRRRLARQLHAGASRRDGVLPHPCRWRRTRAVRVSAEVGGTLKHCPNFLLTFACPLTRVRESYGCPTPAVIRVIHHLGEPPGKLLPSGVLRTYGHEARHAWCGVSPTGTWVTRCRGSRQCGAANGELTPSKGALVACSPAWRDVHHPVGNVGRAGIAWITAAPSLSMTTPSSDGRRQRSR